jgi:UDP-glucose 4-epimerase
MKTLVTGGAGFIGSHVTDELVALGHDVLVIDNLFAGRREYLNPKAQFEHIDMATVPDREWISLVQAFNPDHVVHLAALHYIPYCMAHPEQTFATNVRGTELLVRSLEGLSVLKLVAASTLDVYGIEDVTHVETEVSAPCNVYGLSKSLTESLMAYAARTIHGLSAASLRFSNAYGPRETNPHLIPRVIELLGNDLLPELRMGYLDGTRDFVHVSDVARAVVAVLLADTAKYDAFNVATGRQTSSREVIRILQKAFGDTRAVIEDRTQFRKFDRQSLAADITKIREEVGWAPRIPVEQGLPGLVPKQQTAAEPDALVAAWGQPQMIERGRALP